MRILLAHPANYGMGLNRHAWMAEPLPLECIAAVLPEHEVRIADLRFEPGGIVPILAEFRPRVVGLTCHLTEIWEALGTLRAVKAFDPAIRTLAGGQFASLHPESFNASFVDAVVLGEGEATIRECVEAFEAGAGLDGVAGLALPSRDGMRPTAPREAIADLDALPLPRRDLVSRYRTNYFMLLERPHSIAQFTRGCSNHCRFCSVWKFYAGRYRQMSPARIVEEIRQIPDETICLVDDNFFVDEERSALAAERLLAGGVRKSYFLFASSDLVVRSPRLVPLWKRVGLKFLFLGIEGFDDSDVAGYRKPITREVNDRALEILRANDVGLVASFVVRPEYGREDFDRLFDYVESRRISLPLFAHLTPFPGTDLWDEKQGEILSRNFELYDYLHTVFPTSLPREQFYAEYARLYRRVGSLKRKLRNLLRGEKIRLSEGAAGEERRGALGRLVAFARRALSPTGRGRLREVARHWRNWVRVARALRDPRTYLADDLKPAPEIPMWDGETEAPPRPPAPVARRSPATRSATSATLAKLRAIRDIAWLARLGVFWKLPPRAIGSIDVTWRCNLICAHCYFLPQGHGRELSVAQWVERFDALRASGFPFFHCTWVGGEPLLRRDLLEEGVRRFRYNMIVTNGTLPLSRWPSTCYQVSVDGTEETHDSIRGAGTHRRIRRNLESADSRGVGLLTVLSRRNLGEIEPIVDGWRTTGLDGVLFDFYTPIAGHEDGLALSAGERDEAIVRIARLREKHGTFVRNTPRMLSLGLSDSSAAVTDECRATIGNLYFALDPMGEEKTPCILGPLARCRECGCTLPFLKKAVEGRDLESMAFLRHFGF